VFVGFVCCLCLSFERLLVWLCLLVVFVGCVCWLDIAGTSYIEKEGWVLFWPRFVISSLILTLITQLVFHVLRVRRIEER